MLNHETPVFSASWRIRQGRHEINKITFKRIFSLKTCFRAFSAFCMPRRSEMETGGKNIYI